jgi:hypothetical protein
MPTIREDRQMLSTVWGIVRNGKVELLEPIEVSEGAKVLVTLPNGDDADFWGHASESALDAVWKNSEDDIYGQLLQK